MIPFISALLFPPLGPACYPPKSQSLIDMDAKWCPHWTKKGFNFLELEQVCKEKKCAGEGIMKTSYGNAQNT